MSAATAQTIGAAVALASIAWTVAAASLAIRRSLAPADVPAATRGFVRLVAGLCVSGGVVLVARAIFRLGRCGPGGGAFGVACLHTDDSVGGMATALANALIPSILFAVLLVLPAGVLVESARARERQRRPTRRR